MAKIFWYRTQRLLTSLSAAILVAGGAMIGGLVVAAATAMPNPPAHIPGWIIGALIGGLVLLIAHAIAEFKKQTYDPALIFAFDERFNSRNMRTVRQKASKILKDNRGHLAQIDRAYADIDDVLDFFEDLGFYLHGHQISPEVMHHTFHHWIRGYYLASRDYIAAIHNAAKSKTQWEYIEELYHLVEIIEKKKLKGQTYTLTDSDIREFLEDEMQMVENEVSHVG